MRSEKTIRRPKAKRTDWYSSFAELAWHETENVDYAISVADRDSPVAIIAPHGGCIEPGTSKLTLAIAGDNYSSYLFEGLKAGRNHKELHITSAKFNEESCLKLLARSKIVLGIHGRADKDDQETVWLGGRDTALRDQIGTELNHVGFKTLAGGHNLLGREPSNICNQGLSKAGAQLEIPRSLRDRMVADQTFMSLFADAVRTALLKLIH